MNTENQTIFYSNPTNTKLVLKTYQTSFSEGDCLQLFLINGEQLYYSGIRSQQTTVDISNFPQGIYIVTVSKNGV